MGPSSYAAYEKWKSESEKKQKFSSLRPGPFRAFNAYARAARSGPRIEDRFSTLRNPIRQAPSIQDPLDPGWTGQQVLWQSENQPAQQLDCLGPYWAKRLSPFSGADGMELPMFKLNQDQLEICSGLVQKVDSSCYLQAAVILVREEGETLVAMRKEVGPSPSSDDRGLLTAGSSDNGSTWDFVNTTDELGDPTRVLYVLESHRDLAHLKTMSSSFSTTNGWNSSIGFLLRNHSVVQGSVVYHENDSLSFLLEDGSMLHTSIVMDFVADNSAEDVTMVHAHEAEISMTDALTDDRSNDFL
jgi:hypothetical protein